MPLNNPRPLTKGFIPIPLANWRAVVSNNIDDVTDTPATNDQYGSLLHKGSTPVLEFINGDTDSSLRLHWAATDVTPIVMQIPLPPDLDTSFDVVLHLRMLLDSDSDLPAVDVDSYFNEGDTKVSDIISAAPSDGTYGEKTATIAAADVPSDAQTLTMELTPEAHANDALFTSATWIEYTRIVTG